MVIWEMKKKEEQDMKMPENLFEWRLEYSKEIMIQANFPFCYRMWAYENQILKLKT